jgi:hypothetical protein
VTDVSGVLGQETATYRRIAACTAHDVREEIRRVTDIRAIPASLLVSDEMLDLTWGQRAQ